MLFVGITVTSLTARYLFPVCPTLIPTVGARSFQGISLRSCTEMTPRLKKKKIKNNPTAFLTTG